MRRRVTEDTPSYAAETIRSAQVSGSHLAASSGLVLLLLAGMSFVEAPIPASALPALAQVGSEAFKQESRKYCALVPAVPRTRVAHSEARWRRASTRRVRSADDRRLLWCVASAVGLVSGAI